MSLVFLYLPYHLTPPQGLLAGLLDLPLPLLRKSGSKASMDLEGVHAPFAAFICPRSLVSHPIHTQLFGQCPVLRFRGPRSLQIRLPDRDQRAFH